MVVTSPLQLLVALTECWWQISKIFSAVAIHYGIQLKLVHSLIVCNCLFQSKKVPMPIFHIILLMCNETGLARLPVWSNRRVVIPGFFYCSSKWWMKLDICTPVVHFQFPNALLPCICRLMSMCTGDTVMYIWCQIYLESWTFYPPHFMSICY